MNVKVVVGAHSKRQTKTNKQNRQVKNNNNKQNKTKEKTNVKSMLGKNV